MRIARAPAWHKSTIPKTESKNVSRAAGGVFGVAIAVTAFSGAGGLASAAAFSSGFAAAIGVSAALSLLAAIAGMWLPGPRAVGLAPAGAKA